MIFAHQFTGGFAGGHGPPDASANQLTLKGSKENSPGLVAAATYPG